MVTPLRGWGLKKKCPQKVQLTINCLNIKIEIKPDIYDPGHLNREVQSERPRRTQRIPFPFGSRRRRRNRASAKFQSELFLLILYILFQSLHFIHLLRHPLRKILFQIKIMKIMFHYLLTMMKINNYFFFLDDTFILSSVV